MKRFRRVLSVAVTLILIVTLFSDSLSAAFISAGPGAADPVNDGIVGTVEGDDLDSADPAGDNSAQTPPEQTGDPSADPSTDPTADPNLDPNSGLPNEILGDPVDESLCGEYGIMPTASGDYTKDYNVVVTVTCNDGGKHSKDLSNLSGNIGDLGPCDTIDIQLIWPKGLIPDGHELVDFDIPFNLNPLTEDLLNSLGATIYNQSNSTVAGSITYSDGALHVHFNDEFKSADTTDRRMSTQIQGNFPAPGEQWQAGGSHELQIGEQKYDFTWSGNDAAVNGTKTVGEAQWDEEKKTFYFENTVTFEVTGHGNDLSFTDTVSPDGALKIDPSSIQYVEQFSSSNPPVKAPESSDEKSFSAEYTGEFLEGDRLTVTYRTYIKPEFVGEFIAGNFDVYKSSFNNNLSYNYNGDISNSIDVEAKSKNNNHFNFSLSKSGSAEFLEEKGANGLPKVKYKYTVNIYLHDLYEKMPDPSNHDYTAKEVLEHFDLWDNLKDVLTLPDHPDGIDLTTVIKEKLASLLSKDEWNIGSYVLEYEYVTEDGVDPSNATASNTISDFEVGGTSSVSPSNGSVQKTYASDVADNGAGGKYTWYVEFELPPYGSKDITLSDKNLSVESGNSGYTHKIESVQFQYYDEAGGSWENTTPEAYGGSVKTNNGSEYTITIDGTTETYKNNTHKKVRFVVITKLVDAEGKDVGEDADFTKLVNKGYLLDMESYAEHTKESTTTDLGNKSVVSVTDDGIVTWKVALNGNFSSVTDWNVNAPKIKIEQNELVVTVTDTLGDGLAYIPGSASVSLSSLFDDNNKQFIDKLSNLEGKGSWLTDVFTSNFTVTESGKTITMRFELPAGFEEDANNHIADDPSAGYSENLENGANLYASIFNGAKIIFVYKTKLDFNNADLRNAFINGWKTNNDWTDIDGNLVKNRASIEVNGEIDNNNTATPSIKTKKDVEKVLAYGYDVNDGDGVNSFKKKIWENKKYAEIPFFAQDKIKTDYLAKFGYTPERYENFLFIIDVNRYRISAVDPSLPNAQGYVEIRDTMDSRLSFISDSLRLIEVDVDASGNYIPVNKDVVYDINNAEVFKSVTVSKAENGDSIISINIPDGKHYLLVYVGALDLPNEDDYKQELQNVSNKVEIKLFDTWFENGDKYTGPVLSMTSIASSGKKFQVKVTKYGVKNSTDPVSPDKVLPGATFQLYTVTFNENAAGDVCPFGGDLEPVKEGTLTTNRIGEIESPKLDCNTIYLLRETSAPVGYKKAPDYYFISGDFTKVLDSSTDSEEVKAENQNKRAELERIYNALIGRFGSTNDGTIYEPNDGSPYTFNILDKAINEVVIKDEEHTGSLKVQKVVAKGGSLLNAPANDEFSFEVTLSKSEADSTSTPVAGALYKKYDKNGAEIASGAGATGDNGVATFTLKDGEYVIFDDLPIGTYYAVEETLENENYSVDNGEVEGSIVEASFVQVTNTYTKEVKKTDTLNVTKNFDINGDLEEAEYKFTFEAVPDLSNPAGSTVISTPTITVTKNDITSFTPTVTVIKTGEFKFEFTKVGTYTYTIKEKSESKYDNVQYATDSYVVTFNVEDDNNGGLKVSHTVASGKEPLEFTNTYTKPNSPKASLKLGVKKTVKATNGDPIEMPEFKFELKATGKSSSTLPDESERKVTVHANGDVAYFGVISFDAETLGLTTKNPTATFTYTITEDDASKPAGWEYADPQTVTVTVTLKDDGTLEVNAEYDGKTFTSVNGVLTCDFTFTNTYTKPDASVIFKVSKELIGDWKEVDDKSFKFKLSELVSDNFVEKETITLDASESISTEKAFEKINYTEPGEHDYLIEEVSGNRGGITYDKTQYKIHVSVKNVSGRLEVTSEAKKYVNDKEVEGFDSDTLTFPFANTYSASGSFELEAEKILNNVVNGEEESVVPTDNEFTFKLTAIDDEAKTILKAAYQDYDETTGSIIVHNIGKLVKFGPFNVSSADTLHFILEEVAGNDLGMVYDTTTYNVTVTFEDNGKGHLDSKVSYDKVGIVEVNTTPRANSGIMLLSTVGNATFINIEPKASASINVSKNLTGRDWFDGDEFEFTLTPKAPTTGEIVRKTVTKNNKQAIFDFGPYTIEDVGTYTYTLAETNGGKTINGVTYDDSEYTVTVAVVKADNELTANATITKADGAEVTDEVMTFTNTYDKPTTETEIKVKKTLEGRDWKTGDEFTFTLSGSAGAPMPKDKDGNDVTSVTVNSAEAVSFGTIKYTIDNLGENQSPKTYTYTVAEVDTKIPGVTYDKMKYTVTVTVTLENGKLKAEKHIVKNDNSPAVEPLEFVNTYSTKDTSYQFKAKKVFKNNNHNVDGFTFSLEKVVGETTEHVGQATSDVTGIATFEEITFNEVGDYVYKVTEVKGNNPEIGVTYTTTEYTATVTVIDDGMGKLQVSKVEITSNDESAVGEDKVMTFSNDYEKPTSSIDFEVTKSYNGDWTNAEFTFKSTDENNESVVKKVTKKDETAKFTYDYDIEDAGKTYTYTVTEDATTKIPGVVYDTSTYTVTVTVTLNDGVLTASKSIAKDGAPADSIEFTNTYSTEGSIELSANKTFTNKADYDKVYGAKSDLFTFTLRAATGGEIPDGITSKAAAVLPNPETASTTEGVVNFDGIKITEPGDYVFVISEIIPDDADKIPGMEYDNGQYIVKVTATDNGDGTLKTTKTVVSTNHNETFTNTYTKPTTETEIEVKKTLSGRDWKTDDKFTFTLTGLDGAPMPDNYAPITITSTTTNKTASFGTIKYTIEDLDGEDSKEFTYTITEDATTKIPGVVYDTSTYTVTVTVSLENGKLKAEKRLDDNSLAVEPLEFVNTYSTKDTSYQFKAKKVFKNNNHNVDGFTFSLEKVVGETTEHVGQATSDVTGIATFEEITFNEVGDYVYKVTEVKGNNPEIGVTYATTEYTATVTVIDDGEGKLQVSKVEITSNDESAVGEDKVMTFSNDYEKPTTSIDFEVTKSYNGDWTNAEFTFKSTDENNESVVKKVTKAGEKAKFTYDYDIEDAGKTFTYTVTEDATTKIPGVVYDASTYTVTVTVSLEDGKLTASKSITKNGEPADSIEFTNEFKNTTAHFEATKTVKTVSGNAKTVADYNGKFTFTLKAETENAPMPAKETATNDSEGKVVFGDITYNAPGTYRYIIEEKGGDENGIFYSESVYRATVVVSTADDNSLTASEPTYELQSADGKTYTSAPSAAFENDYTAPYGSLTLNGTKKFAKNTESAAPTITDPLTFVFDVYAEATGSLLYSVPVSVDDINDEYRIEKLLDLNFDESNIGKTYRYRIVEHAINANDEAYAGFAKDNAEYIVEVKVGEPDRYNVITSTYTITKDGEKADDIVFTNTYTALTASTSITVSKNLTGRGWLNDDKFEFTLTSAIGEVAKKTVSSADEKAQFDFGPYTIADVGTYTYTLAETNGGKTIDGVTYDDSKYTVTVKVAYADGKLTATPTIANVTGTNVTFTNKYAASGSFSLTAKKIYKENGSEVEIGGKKFTFGLTSVDNDIISAELTSTNNGNDVSFGPFSIPAPGTYKFSLREIVTDPVAGMTYDTEAREITVVATDNNKGGYNITVNGNPAAAENNTGVTFTNEYNYNGFSVTKTVEGTKGVEERETLDFGFKVTLTYNDAPFTGAVKADKEIVGEGDGVYTFTLKHGETVNFSEIPYGVKYFVEETEAHGYTKSAENAEGVIDKDAHEAKFVNFKDKDKVGLSLTKIVTGTDGETERLFNFTITLTQPLTGRYGELEFTEGVAHVAIKSGDTVSVTGLPADIGYTVTEAEANTEDYFTTVVNATSEGIPEGTTAEVVFTNHRDRKLGGLSVSKTVSGTDPDYNKSFNFTVTLNDRSINGMFGQMYFVNGSANITLAHGQTVVADGLPAGIGYTVYEYNSDDFEVSAFGNTGVIPENSYARASFVNTRDKKFGDLSVSKTVDGDEGWDPEQTFEFTVTLSDSTVEGVYGGMTFADGIAHVVLKAGETATATRLPEGITYTVTEAPVEDFTQSATGDSGVIAADTTASAVFVNTYEAKKLGNLSVTKTVSGDAADMTKVFGFRVILSDAEINGLYGDMYFENGFANIYLSHGQTATAIGLPEGTGYSVIELDSEDYIVTATGTAGFIIADYTVPASFNNHKDQPDIPEVPEEDERHGDDSLAGVGRDRPTGDDSLAGVGMDDMNPATGDYEAESFANGTSAIVILWTMVFLFGAVVIAKKRREDR